MLNLLHKYKYHIEHTINIICNTFKYFNVKVINISEVI